MADVLTHVFLPLTAAYVLRPGLFPSGRYLLLGSCGLVSDFDKVLGEPGLLHSLITIGPICLGILAFEWLWYNYDNDFKYGPLIVAMVLSHLVLDFVDGGPVPLLYPFVETGIGVQYPVNIVFGTGPLGIALDGPLIAVRTGVPKSGYNTYGLINGFGIASTLLFLTIYFGQRWRDVPN